MSAEHRSCRGTVEIRKNDQGKPMIAGYAAVFNSDSLDLGFIEQVDPKAFDKTVKEADVRGLANHQPDWTLGRVKAGTLRLAVDNVGLRYEIDVNEEDPDGIRALQKVKRGDWDGSSFSFSTIRDEWNWDATPPQRRLLEVALIDVGPVCFPAYPDSSAAARALEPIAARTGHNVDELVSAMKTGEIRSLLSPATERDETQSVIDDPHDLAEVLAEAREGKKLSAASMAKIRAAMESLRELIGADDDGADDESLLDQALESDSIDQAKENDSLRMSIDAAERELRLRDLAMRNDVPTYKEAHDRARRAAPYLILDVDGVPLSARSGFSFDLDLKPYRDAFSDDDGLTAA